MWARKIRQRRGQICGFTAEQILRLNASFILLLACPQPPPCILSNRPPKTARFSLCSKSVDGTEKLHLELGNHQKSFQNRVDPRHSGARSSSQPDSQCLAAMPLAVAGLGRSRFAKANETGACSRRINEHRGPAIRFGSVCNFILGPVRALPLFLDAGL
jgi:hypothetical protein